MSHHISTLCGQNAVWGLPQKKEVIPIAGDDLVFLDFLSRPPCGGMSAFAFARRARQSRAVFVFALALLAGLRFLLRYTTTGAEADARVRGRGRSVSAQRKR